MKSDIYLYKYLVREQGTGKLLAEYESDSAPPSIGATIDIAEFVKSLDKAPFYRIVAMQYQPFKSDELEPSSRKMLVEVEVEPLYK